MNIIVDITKIIADIMKIIVDVTEFIGDVWTKSVVTSFDVVMYILIVMCFLVYDDVEHRDKD